METISRNLLTFLLNSLWQVPLAAAVAALACWFMRNGPARHRHMVWVAALIAAILLPLASVRRADSGPRLQFDPALAAAAGTPSAHVAVQPPPASTPVARTVSLAATTAGVLLGVYLLFVLCRIVLLARAALRTAQIRRSARAVAIPEPLRRVALRCAEACGAPGAELLFSAQISGPVAAGPAIILPDSLLEETSEDVLTTAIGHEMAHIARCDFAGNILYEVLHLPLSFHPAAWLIRREIGRTREVACDELVTQRLLDARVYAQSIVRIAAGMTAVPSPGYSLGVFDGDILEERIRRLVERPATSLKRARLLLAAGLSALAACAVIASSVALTARAQGGVDAQSTIAQLENAVRLAPSDLKARLLLANALLRDYVPGSDPGSPLVTRARQQYLDVLAQDPRNHLAMQGMMVLSTNTKQFAEAHEWAVKAIQADATDKTAYYTAGFVDWAMTYPDYGAARTAAGMKPWDPGIIPDAGLRQKVRSEHEAQLQDGFRMLETAVQLDPEYSDAMAYTNLLYRIEAGIADTDAQYKEYIAKADSWVDKALAAKQAQAQHPQPSSMTMVQAPPPPPPPPPPPAQDALDGSAPWAIRVEPAIQAQKLVSRTAPVYPQDAKEAGISGTVQMRVVIGPAGRVQDIRVISGPPPLIRAALEAVKQWAYQPTLLNGEAVGVLTTVTVNFAPRH